MASKSKKSTRKAQPRAADLAGSAVESGQKIWLAGLGAYERAKQEGPKMFETLVARGRALRGQAREAADQALKSMRAQADAAGAQAAGKWDKLEQVFEERVSKSLNRLGVLSGKDVDVLARQVAELNDSVRALMGGKSAPARPATKKRAASKKKRSAKKAKKAKAAA
jgi:poly(hydroxyalkanoate) granule-associated protein